MNCLECTDFNKCTNCDDSKNLILNHNSHRCECDQGMVFSKINNKCI